MAWLTNWNKRKQIYINGTSAGGQSSYQIKITIYYGSGTDSPGNIYCGGNCKTDFSDIRFTDTDGTSLLYYWVDQANTTNSSKATIWVKIPNIPTGSNSANVYIYYNNPNATTASSGSNTFVFFDDFPTTSLSNYTITSSPGTGGGLDNTHIDSSTYISSPYSIYVGGPYNNGGSPTTMWSKAARTLSIPSGSYEVDFWTKTYYGTSLGPSYVNYSYTQINGSTQVSSTVTTWTYYSFAFSGTAISSITLWNQWYGWNGGPASWWDDIRIRKYASPEPTWSSTISAEQGSSVLNIYSTPTGAEIYIATPTGSSFVDQNTSTNTTLYLSPGSYDLKLTKGGYEDYILTNQSYLSGQTYNIQATLTQIPGSLAISSTPIGAEIWLSGYDYGVRTNTTITGLNPSPPNYNIILKLSGYQDWTGSATVYSQLTTTVIATFAGSANIISSPSGASIYLDGNITPSGTTPVTITNLTPATSDGSAPTQSHTYNLKLAGYADTSGSFNAIAGQSINVQITFPGSLYISSLPEGASIYIDGVLQ